MKTKDLQRFQKFIELDLFEGCWLWKGSLRDGYGGFSLDGVWQSAHRVSFTHWNGIIPKGLEIDHLCRNRNCVNPSHLQSVTHVENIRRGRNRLREMTYCKHGHKFTEENTYVRKNGSRQCKTCKIIRKREYRRRLKIVQ